MAKRERKYGLVDLATGEMFQAVISPWRRQVGGKWMKVFLASKQELLRRSPDLHGQSHRVLAWLETLVAWGNRLPSPTKLAETSEIPLSTVSRAYRELALAECIYKQDGTYFLSPLVGWHGSSKDLDQAYQQFFASKTPHLTTTHSTGARLEQSLAN